MGLSETLSAHRGERVRAQRAGEVDRAAAHLTLPLLRNGVDRMRSTPLPASRGEGVLPC